MAENLCGLIVSLPLQSDNLTCNTCSVNKQIQEAESFLKTETAI